MNEKSDLLILSHLRQNSRISLTKLSRKTHIPASTIYDRIKYFNENIIKRNTSFIDFSKLGYLINAMVMIKIDKGENINFRNYLLRCNNLNTLIKINNKYDYLIEVVFKNMGELEEFKDNLEKEFKIKKLEIYHIIEEIEKEAFLSSPDDINIIK